MYTDFKDFDMYVRYFMNYRNCFLSESFKQNPFLLLK